MSQNKLSKRLELLAFKKKYLKSFFFTAVIYNWLARKENTVLVSKWHVHFLVMALIKNVGRSLSNVFPIKVFVFFLTGAFPPCHVYMWTVRLTKNVLKIPGFFGQKYKWASLTFVAQTEVLNNQFVKPRNAIYAVVRDTLYNSIQRALFCFIEDLIGTRHAGTQFFLTICKIGTELK